MQPNSHEKPHKHQLIVPVTVLDDDEWGGLRLKGGVVLWSGLERPRTPDINEAFDKLEAAHRGEQPLEIGKDILEIDTRIVRQKRKILAPLVGKTLKIKVNEWSNKGVYFGRGPSVSR